MRSLEAISIEKIDGQLCIVFKADDSRHRGVLGSISSGLLQEVAAEFQRIAEMNAETDSAALMPTAPKRGKRQ